MRLFDSHCHINDKAFDADRDEVVRRMLDAGVEKAVVVGDATLSPDEVTRLSGKYGFLYKDCLQKIGDHMTIYPSAYCAGTKLLEKEINLAAFVQNS